MCLIHATGEIQLHSVGEVPSVCQAQSQDSVSGISKSHHYRCVSSRPRVRLNIDILSAVQLFGPVPGKVLSNVNHLAAAVVALARIALRILVG